MIISILHLSDIHFKIGHNVILNRKDKLFQAVKNQIKGNDAIFILTSGDIAFSGQKPEYEMAFGFYKELYDSFSTYTGLQPQFIFSPGNHDCHFIEEKEGVRSLILDSFSKTGFSQLQDYMISQCCEPQKHFFEFKENMKSIQNAGDNVLNHPLLDITTYQVNGVNLKFSMFNTAWMSTLQERMGKLNYPISVMADKIPSADCQFSISIIHHPLSWSAPEFSREFINFLMQTSEFIVSGHEHIAGASFLSDLEEDFRTIRVEGPALQDSNNERTSGFFLLQLDTDSRCIQMIEYDYSSEAKTYTTKQTSEWVKIDKNKKLRTKPFQIKSEFIKKLQDPGAGHTHALADHIKLSDLYVHPFLQNINIDRKKNKRMLMEFVHSDSAFSDPGKETSFYKILVGNESSGKTALLRTYYLKYFELGFFPVYLPSAKINGADINRIKKMVAAALEEQYDELEGKFDCIDYSKIIVFVDDFHLIDKPKAKVWLVKNLKKLFSKIVLTGYEVLIFENFKDKNDNPVELYEDFDWYCLREFSPSLRADLITKWYRLGREYLTQDEQNELYRKIDHAKHTINSFIGKNFVPPYPIYVLAILQTLDSNLTDTGDNKQHAYYYEYLITRSLGKILKDKEEIGFYITVCKEYFYFLFIEKIRFKPISEADFMTFLERHKRDYRISNDSVQVLQVLLNSRILSQDADRNVSITYKYLYYYFVAKYIADNLDEPSLKEIVDLMAERVYRDEYSNIIIFLTHLARNSYLINLLVAKSQRIYHEHSPLQLLNDITFINELQKEVPELVLKDIKVEEARKQELEEENDYEKLEQEMEELSLKENYDLREDLNNLDFLSQLSKALRTINILGELTKRYWGELKGANKYNLAEETFLLALRTLSYEMKIVKEGAPELIRHVKKILRKKNLYEGATIEQIEDVSSNLVFNICSSMTFSILKRVVDAIGSEKLSGIFNEIEESHPFCSVNIAHVAIKMEHFKNFPMVDLDKLRIQNEKNFLAISTLQQFVMQYMYMYDIAYDKRQQLSEKFHIKLPEQLLISKISPVKKVEEV